MAMLALRGPELVTEEGFGDRAVALGLLWVLAWTLIGSPLIGLFWGWENGPLGAIIGLVSVMAVLLALLVWDLIKVAWTGDG